MRICLIMTSKSLVSLRIATPLLPAPLESVDPCWSSSMTHLLQHQHPWSELGLILFNFSCGLSGAGKWFFFLKDTDFGLKWNMIVTACSHRKSLAIVPLVLLTHAFILSGTPHHHVLLGQILWSTPDKAKSWKYHPLQSNADTQPV